MNEQFHPSNADLPEEAQSKALWMELNREQYEQYYQELVGENVEIVTRLAQSPELNDFDMLVLVPTELVSKNNGHDRNTSANNLFYGHISGMLSTLYRLTGAEHLAIQEAAEGVGRDIIYRGRVKGEDIYYIEMVRLHDDGSGGDYLTKEVRVQKQRPELDLPDPIGHAEVQIPGNGGRPRVYRVSLPNGPKSEEPVWKDDLKSAKPSRMKPSRWLKKDK